MKNLKLLNKNFIITIFTIFILSITKVSSEEATDIWSLNNETENINVKDNQSSTTSEINVLLATSSFFSIFQMSTGSLEIADLKKVIDINKTMKNLLNCFKIFIRYYFFYFFIRCRKVNFRNQD